MFIRVEDQSGSHYQYMSIAYVLVLGYTQDALCVWAYLALKAKRYRWIIYSWGYGDEVYDLIGYSYSEEYLNSEVRRYMEECLFENEHITGVQDLEVSQIKDVLHIKFTLVTDVGSKEVEMDV